MEHDIRKLALEMAIKLSLKADASQSICEENQLNQHIENKRNDESHRTAAFDDTHHLELSYHEIDHIVDFISHSCSDSSDGTVEPAEISLVNLEAAFRKYKKAKAIFEGEEHARALMVSFQYLLESSNKSLAQWFIESDVRGAIGGDGKLTYSELKYGINNLCRQLKLAEWSEHNMHLLLKYMDPSGDGDLSSAEIELAYRKFQLPSHSQLIFDAAGPLIVKLEKFMHRRRMRVRDLFQILDHGMGHRTMTLEELKQSLQRLLHIPVPADHNLEFYEHGHHHSQKHGQNHSDSCSKGRNSDTDSLRSDESEAGQHHHNSRHKTAASPTSTVPQFGHCVGPAPPVVDSFAPQYIPMRRSVPILQSVRSSSSLSPKTADTASINSSDSGFNTQFNARLKPLVHIPTQHENSCNPTGMVYSTPFKPLKSSLWQAKQKSLTELLGEKAMKAVMESPDPYSQRNKKLPSIKGGQQDAVSAQPNVLIGQQPIKGTKGPRHKQLSEVKKYENALRNFDRTLQAQLRRIANNF